MPRELYQIADLNIIEINRILASISERLNFISNDGDNISLTNTKFTNLASGTADTDAIRKDQAFLLTDLASIILGTVDEITVTDNGDETLTISLPGAIKLDGATASRLLATDANKKTASVADLTAWIAGTASRITVSNDGDGTITITIPNTPSLLGLILTSLTDGYIPYHVSDAVGLADSPLFTDGTNIGLGTATPDTLLHLKKDNATAILRLERNDTTIGTDDIVARIEAEGQDTGAPGVCLKIEAIGEGNDGETGLRISTGIAGALIETLRLSYLGYLGIGTVEPDVKLHVEDAAGAVQRMTRNDTAATADDIIGRIEFETRDSDAAGVAAIIQAVTESTLGRVGLAFFTGAGASAVERFRIKNTGIFEHNQQMQQFSGTKTLADGVATGFVDILVAAGERVGGIIEYVIDVTDGSDYQVHSGVLTFAAANKAGTITTDIDEVYLVASETHVMTAGTLTDAWTITDGGTKITINCDANTSLAGATLTLKYTIRLQSTNTILPL